MSDWFSNTALSGSLVLAVPIAILAGLVSFFSPCVMPLLPGYLSYITGLAVTDLDGGKRGRMLAGSTLFVLGFTAVFVSLGVAFGSIGMQLAEHARTLSIITGFLIIVLGFAFIGWIPLMQREVRIHSVPAIGLAAAPLLGIFFAVGWTPCIGPTLAVVLGMSMTPGASTGRGAFLTFAYCLGLGIPFILAALGFGRFMHTIEWFKKHQRAVSLVGGGLLIVVGIMLVTGSWDSLVNEMRSWFPGYETVI
ncbi:MAG: cytochrome c biogenesis protein CcdA [Kineosporiaceae bacterium]|nr:cytochrome c biogenesis protein CcdA [Aeromicrobium sp.]